MKKINFSIIVFVESTSIIIKRNRTIPIDASFLRKEERKLAGSISQSNYGPEREEFQINDPCPPKLVRIQDDLPVEGISW